MPKVTSEKPTRKTTAIKEPMNKTQLLAELAENTGLARKDVAAVIDELSEVMQRHLKKRGAGQFTMPGLMKITTQRKPATKERKGINPFTKEEVMFKAKPASTVVKVRPLARLKAAADE